MTRARPVSLPTVLVVLIGILLVAPAFVVAGVSVSPDTGLHFPPGGFSLRWYASFFESPLWTGGATTSLAVATCSAALATVLGTAAAFGLVRGRYPARNIVNALLLGPLLVPTIVVAIGMYLQYTRWGLTGSLLGLIAGHTCLSLPFVVLNVAASLRNLDTTLESAAQSLGANPARTFIRVTLPLIAPGVVAGALIAFILSWDEVVVAIFLSSPLTRTLPAVMWGEIHSRVDPTSAAVATMLAIVPLLFLAGTTAMRRRVASG